jgi:WD40 repeat protein
MQLKSIFLVVGLLGILGITGYFALRNAHASPVVVTEKRAVVTLESPAEGAFSGLARSRDGHLLAIVKDNKQIGTWDSRWGTGTNVRVLESSGKEWLYSPTFSPDGSLLATPSNTPNLQNSGHLLLWDPAAGQRLASVDNLSWPLCCAIFNPAGTFIAVAGNTTLYLVDPSTREITQQVEMERVVNGVIEAMAFNPKGDLLATAKRNGKVELWQVPNLNLVRTLSVGPSLRSSPASSYDTPAHPQAVSVTFAHNVPRLAANNSEGSVFVWDVNTGKEIVRYVGSASGAQGNSSVYAPLANSLSFTLDDRWLLTIDQKTNGIRLLRADRHQETDNMLTVPKHGVLETVNASATDGSVAFSYRIFHPGETGPPTAKVEIWSLQLR